MSKITQIFAIKSGDKMVTPGIVTSEGVTLIPGAVTGSTVYDPDEKLNMLKKHVKADDFNDDDDYLRALLESAEEYVCKATNRTLGELVKIGGGDMPKMLEQAELLLAGEWYSQREAVSSGQMVEVPYTISALIKPFTKLAD